MTTPAPARGPEARADACFRRAAFAWIALAGAIRLVWLLVAQGPLDLAPDEAYYWDWSRRPDWGYFSKPPLIAWLYALATAVGGINEYAVRIPTVLFATAGLVFSYLLADRMFGARAAFWTVVLLSVAPAQAALNLVFTIDAPFLAFWTASLWAIWRALEPDDDRTGRWVLAGALSALALLSKQSALALPAFAGLFILLSRQDWFRLARPGIWTYGAVTALGLLPTLIWNMRRGWVTVEHMAMYVDGRSRPIAERLADGAEFLGAQAGVHGPVAFVIVVGALAHALVNWRRIGRPARFLALFSAVPLAIVTPLAFGLEILINWPAPFYAAAFVLAGGVCAGTWPGNGALARLGRLRRWAVGVSAALCGAAMVLPFLLVPLGLAGSPVDPLSKNLRGWEDLAARVQEIRASRPELRAAPILVAGHRQPVGALGFYLPDHPRVYRWNGLGYPDSQYELWPGPDERLGDDFLVLTMDPVPDAALAATFRGLEPLGEVRVELGGRRRHLYHAFHGRDLSAWPPDVRTRPAH